MGEQTPETTLTLAAEVQGLCKKLKAQEKEIKRLNQLNEFWEEAFAFFDARTPAPEPSEVKASAFIAER